MRYYTLHLADFLVFLVSSLITSLGFLLIDFLDQSNFLSILNETLGNSGSVPAASFLFMCWTGESSFKKRETIIISVGLGFAIYEFLQIIIPWSTFDVNDLIGTLAGVVLASVINLIIVLWFRQKEY